MNCIECEKRLDDYVDGLLSPETARSVSEHLADCPSCSTSFEELRLLQKASEQIPREIEPPTDLWPEIIRRIDVSPHSMSSRRATRAAIEPWLQLAAVISLVAIGLWVSISLSTSRPNPRTTRQAQAVDPSPSWLAEQADRARAEDRTMLAKIDLIQTIERRRGVLDAATVQQIEADRLVIDRAIGEIRAALRDQPENRSLKMALAARYQQEIRLLQRIGMV